MNQISAAGNLVLLPPTADRYPFTSLSHVCYRLFTKDDGSVTVVSETATFVRLIRELSLGLI
jgi:hypothetical protein